MLYGSAIFLALALTAAAFGLSGLPSVAGTLAWFWSAVFLGLTLSALWRWHDDHHHHH
jgi:hypothetical protein